MAAFEARALDVELGDASFELVSPDSLDSALGRFIERRGEGVYSIALEVDDLEAAIDELNERGVRVSEPVEVTEGVRSAFVSMAATHGVSVQLVEGTGTREATSTTAGEEPTQGSDEPPVVQQRMVDLRPDEWEEWSDAD
jgi:hypothetical protein